VVFGIWYLVFGIWYLVFGIWYLVFGSFRSAVNVQYFYMIKIAFATFERGAAINVCWLACVSKPS